MGLARISWEERHWVLVQGCHSEVEGQQKILSLLGPLYTPTPSLRPLDPNLCLFATSLLLPTPLIFSWGETGCLSRTFWCPEPLKVQRPFHASLADGLGVSPLMKYAMWKEAGFRKTPLSPFLQNRVCFSWFWPRALLEATRRGDGGLVCVCRALSVLHRLGACVQHRAWCVVGAHGLTRDGV